MSPRLPQQDMVDEINTQTIAVEGGHPTADMDGIRPTIHPPESQDQEYDGENPTEVP